MIVAFFMNQLKRVIFDNKMYFCTPNSTQVIQNK